MEPLPKKFAGTRARVGQARDRDVEVFYAEGRKEEYDVAC